MSDPGALHVIAVRPTPRPVDELVAHDEVARLDVRLQAACRVGSDDALHPQILEGPEVGAVVDRRRRDGVLRAVTGQEGDSAAGNRTDRDAVAGLSVRRADFDELDVVQKLVEPRPAENAYG